MTKKRPMQKMTRYVCYDIARNKIVLAYASILFIITIGLFNMEEQNGKAIMSLLSIVLLAVPLISLVFSAIYYYNAYEFTELMLCQPVSRSRIIRSQYTGVASILLLAFLIGVGIPVCIYAANSSGITLLLAGSGLTLVFTALGLLVSVRTKDKARGIGAVLLLWFLFSIIYDAIILLILFTFSEYPLEKLTVGLSMLNPIDLARISMMLKTDNSALMGYTGALYNDFFGSAAGSCISLFVLLMWIFIPLQLAVNYFKKKDM
jgi:Cu-processing system permease protein